MDCVLCNEPYVADHSPPAEDRRPRLLACGHSSCLQCLAKLHAPKRQRTQAGPNASDASPLADPLSVAGAIETANSAASIVLCPFCRSETRLGSGGVRGLPINFGLIDSLALLDKHVQPAAAVFSGIGSDDSCADCQANASSIHCPKCEQDFCHECANRIHATRALQSHKTQFLRASFKGKRRSPSDTQAQAPPSIQCPAHGASLNIWCVSDRVVVCEGCVADARHKGHELRSVDMVAVSERKEPSRPEEERQVQQLQDDSPPPLSAVERAEQLHRERKYAEAAALFRSAAECGDPRAQGWLSWYLQEPKWGLPSDDARAYSLAEASAGRGDAVGQSALGECYFWGRGVAMDNRKAFDYYSLSAAQGLAPAQHNVGICCQHGFGVAKDDKKAFEYHQLAADQGYAKALNVLGFCYGNGIGVAKDDKKAFEYYLLAANQGDDGGQNNVGVYYREGRGVAKDLAKSVEYFQLAANQGLAAGQCDLGAAFATGSGVAQDHRKAVEYYQLAADQGDAIAQLYLALSYERGEGVSKDIAKAVELYRLSAAQGDEDAKKALTRLGLR